MVRDDRAVTPRVERGAVWMQWTEAASVLGVKQGTVLRLLANRSLPSEETSAGIVMVRRADVERLAAGRKRTPVAVRLSAR